MTIDKVNVSLFLSEVATITLSDLCGVFGMSRKELVSALADNYHYLCLEDFRVRDPGPIKVQSEMPEAFVGEAVSLLKAEKNVAISSIFDQLFSQPIIDGHLFQFPEPLLEEALSEALRWFRFGTASGLSVEDSCRITNIRLLRFERSPDQTEAPYTCYGRFDHALLEPYAFGFRGLLSDGGLHLDVVIPL